MGDPVETPGIPPILVAQAGSATVPTRPGVARPAAPSPPTVTPPAISTPDPSDWPGRALAMVKQLADPTGLDNVRTEIGKLTKDERNAIDAALRPFPKTRPKLVAEAYLLRRLIRIARNPPASAPAHAEVKATGGTAVSGIVPKVGPDGSKRPDGGKKVDAVPVFRGKVAFLTGVDIGTGRPSSGYSLTYTGPATTDLRWLQFIWRMVVVDYKGTGARLTSSTAHFRTNNKDEKPFLLTTDAASPRWTVDTTKHGLGPFYEEFVNRSPTEVALFDAPGPSELANRLFQRLVSPTGEKLTVAPKRVVEHFRAATYLVNGLDVLYRANIHFIWDFTSSTEPAATLDPKDKPSWALVGKIDPAHRAVLHLQYPLTDYLPGDALGPPDLFDAFEPVPPLDEVEYAKATNNAARFQVIADLASARMVPAVIIEPTLAINGTPRDVQAVRGGTGVAANQGLKPGLNLTPPLSAGGETGVLDTQGYYHNPDMPTDRDGEPPRVAIKLGNPAFELNGVRPESAPISTMRHEMLHATHYHLAIAWLLAWRDELTMESFGDWLLRKGKTGKRPTPIERSYVASGVTNDLTVTEILAHTEGVVAALPFLPATINFDRDLLTDGRWPGALVAIDRAIRKFKNRGANRELKDPIEQAVKARLSAAICPLTKDQRTALRTWIELLKNPGASSALPSAPTAVQKAGIAVLTDAFSPIQDFVKALDAAEKACPPAP